ncbi:SulP family inorganic anion transporter [Sanguibacter antarcticus]|uniref:SulP family sulfate permease n=1 Tax=Sanguibacter antarcticus TaxID=372484 RepID=A0A2A9E598_9MICO|nr:SulP family inorganic anion transporter [Sanguibacter antarcticus]PFG33339.1 SulP family sulfate permease [Sanguibacter antarcticus]
MNQDWQLARTRLAARTLPRRSDYAGLRRSWRGDLIAGVTVSVVALPLALGFGVTSGVGARAGIITAIVAGIVAGFFGGSNLQVSGPTGAMTVVLVPVVAQYGPSSVVVVSIMAGIVVVAVGLLGMGRLVNYIPWPVVEGFTFGIGAIIFLQQVPLALDTTAAAGENTAVVAVRTLAATAWPDALPALGVVLLVIATMLLITRVRRTLPASLFAIVAATIVAHVAHLDVRTIGALPAILNAPHLPSTDLETVRSLVSAALAVAALAALESLLSAQVADGMADDIPRTQPNRELVGQGLANIASGLFGGMPATGAIARTAVNLRSGAHTRVAAITHAVALAAIVLAAAPLVAQIPLSALAGVLIVTALRMIDLRTARSILRSTRSDGLVFALTAFATMAFDLITAVGLGVLAAILLALRALARASHLDRVPVHDTEVSTEDEHQLLSEHIAVYRIDGALFFADARRFLDELLEVTDVHVVILRLKNVTMLDASGANALSQLVQDLARHHVAVLVKGLRPEHRHVMASVGVLAELERRNHLFVDLDTAIEHARKHVRRAQAAIDTA